MSTSVRERIEVLERLERLGIAQDDRHTLRRIAMTLHRWHEKECGDGYGCIERDETTDKPYWLNSNTMKRYAIPDKEKGAHKRLAKLMKQYPNLTYFVQTDPRGASLYILTSEQAQGFPIEQIYSRGVAVY